MKKFRISIAIALLIAGMFVPTATEAQVIESSRQQVAPDVVLVKTQPQRLNRNRVKMDGPYRYKARRNQEVRVDGPRAKKRQNRKRKAVARHRARCH